MGSDRYCLRWNNHQNNLLGVFSQLLQEESLVDVTLACSEGHSIRAHKVVLSACSSYFQSLFLDHPNRHPIIILKDVCFAELRTLVEFMYRGEVNLDYCQLPTFLKTAKSLQVKGLTEMTHLHKSLSPEREILCSDDGQTSSRDEMDDMPSVIATTDPNMMAVAAHEPLPLIRRRSRSPSDEDTVPAADIRNSSSASSSSSTTTVVVDTVPQTIPTATTTTTTINAQPLSLSLSSSSPPLRTSACPSAAASSPTRSTSTAGYEISQPHSPSSRLPMSVSPPHPADSSSIGDDQRSITPDPDDDESSLHSGPSDMTIGREPLSPPHRLKILPGPSNFLPTQERPLSLSKKEPNDSTNWIKTEEKSSGGNSGSDFSINRHLDQDRERDFERQAVYTCTYCGAAFPHQSKLTRHILSHSLDSLKYREQSQPHLQYAPHPAALSAASAATLGLAAAAVGENASDAEWSGLRTPLMELAHDASQTSADAAESPGAVCKFCGKAFPDVSSLIGHLPAHTGDRPFKCEYCGKAFKLRHHMKDHCRVHTGERPFRCSLCGKTFSRSTILKAHEKTHYPKYTLSPLDLYRLQPNFLLPPGTSATPSPTSLDQLSSSSRSSTPFLFPPYILPSPFLSGDNLSLYSLIQAQAGSLFGSVAPGAYSSPNDLSQRSFIKCAICLAGFPSGWLLEQHTLLQHSGEPLRRPHSSAAESGSSGSGKEEKPFQCDQCGQSYRYRSAYIKHREQNHRARLPADKLFTCEICGMQFRYLKSFKKHRLNHTLEMLQPNIAGIGRKESKQQHQQREQLQQQQLAQQQQSGSQQADARNADGGQQPTVVSESQVSSSNEVEPQSSAAASTAAKDEPADSLASASTNIEPTLFNLLRYPPSTERQRERQLFACSFCSKTVRSKENLKLHVRKHTGERPFACLFCGRAFGGKSDLTRHVRIHTGERPYHCEMCGKCFARADYLSKHLTTHLHNSHNARASTTSD